MDLAPLRKRHVPSMLMATYDSVSSDTSTKGGILEVLLSLASSPSAGVYLVEHAGILSWLRLLLSSPAIWQPSSTTAIANKPNYTSADHDVSSKRSAAVAGGADGAKDGNNVNAGEDEASREGGGVALRDGGASEVGALREGGASEVGAVCELLLQLTRYLPSMRPALALDELALVTRTLLHMRTNYAASQVSAGAVAEAAGTGGEEEGQEEGVLPSLVTVLELVRCVLRRRSRRLGGRVGGVYDVAV